MTIDKAIALVNIENECIKRAENCNRKCNECELVQETDTLLDLYKQLAEWLEELKKYREYINLLENPKQYQLGSQDGIVVGNNKAIDDFVNACKDNVLCKTFGLRENDIEQIAEQLKAGGEDDS